MRFSLLAYSSEPQTGHLNSKPFSFNHDVSNPGEYSAKLAPPYIGRLTLSSNIEELAMRKPIASIHRVAQRCQPVEKLDAGTFMAASTVSRGSKSGFRGPKQAVFNPN